jgi:hypothetical protein
VTEVIEEVHSAGTEPLFYNDEQALRSVIHFAYIGCVDEFSRRELSQGTAHLIRDTGIHD